MFGGFPLDGYVFKIRDPDDPRGLKPSRGGFVLDSADYHTREQAHEAEALLREMGAGVIAERNWARMNGGD